jgi:NAD(P)-dependent dehydrogenase (short-subunit alcohol dehydrogenase family)
MSGNTWMITGVSSGLGRKLAGLKAQYGSRFWKAHLDVTDSGEVRKVVDAAFAELGRIEVVVNNAGYGLFGAAEEVSDEQIRHQLHTNLIGPIHVVRAALPHLRAQGGGRIIQISSYGGQATNPGASLYNASKWGIEGFMEATAQDVAGFNVGVTIVEPGAAETGFRSNGAQLGNALPAYDDTPASLARSIKTSTHPAPGDAAKIADAIINSAAENPAPLRLVLGSDAYRYIHAALSERLAALEQEKGRAFSTDLTQVAR